MTTGSKQMEQPRAEALADMLVDQHDGGQRFTSFAKENGIKSISDAYDVQDAFVARLKGRFGNLIGYKIGLTSQPMQKFCGIDQPISGVVLSRRVFQSGATVRTSDFGRLGLEFEIAVRMASDPPSQKDPYSAETIASHVDAVCAAVELVDDRAADYSHLEVLSLLADNSWNGGIVLSDFRTIGADLASVKGTILQDGRLLDQGHGRDVMGHPMNPLAWLANHLASRGESLKAGQIVMTGW
jgi:2-keto-4-pentenoate hydratase